MYKGANQNAQDAARRVKLSDLERGAPSLTDEDRRGALVAKWKQLNALVCAGNLRPQKRKEIGKEMCAIQEAISAIRPKKKCPGAADYFVDVVRESVTGAQFKIWLAEASRRHDEASAKCEAA